VSRMDPSSEERWMRRAIALAERGRGRVEPNPLVGCVIVRDNRIIGEGFHRKFGGPHAEIDALRRCSGSARGASVYVTLEPCCHHGKTPPCVDALVEAGVARVTAALRDPFPAVAGKGLRRLRQAGIEVHVGLCQAEAKMLNRAYLKLRRAHRPWVILKWAQSLDGKIATRDGTSKWISSVPARREAHRLRGQVDAILVGIETVLADDPLLTCRHVRPRRVATRIVLDSRLRLPENSRLVRTAGEAPVLVATTAAGARRARGKRARLERAGCEVLVCPVQAGRVKLEALLDELGRRELTNVLVEGGGRVLGAFFEQGLADEAVVFVAPKLMADAQARPALRGRGERDLAALAEHQVLQVRRIGPDVMWQLLIRR